MEKKKWWTDITLKDSTLNEICLLYFNLKLHRTLLFQHILFENMSKTPWLDKSNEYHTKSLVTKHLQFGNYILSR